MIEKFGACAKKRPPLAEEFCGRIFGSPKKPGVVGGGEKKREPKKEW